MAGGQVLSPRVGMVLRAALLVIGLSVLVSVLLASRPAAAQTDPPASGTWEVNDTTYWDKPVTIMGDVVVGSGGDLTLKDMQLVFWCLQKSEFGVKVSAGGRLSARNVEFLAKNSSFPFKFILNTNSVADIRDCTIRNVGNFGSTKDTWGIYVHSPYVTFANCTIIQCNVGLLVHGLISPVIRGCTISDNYDRGIWCMYSSPVIADNRLENNSFGIFLEESPGPVLMNNDLVANRREALAMDDNSSVPEWIIDRAVAWTGSTVLLRGNLTVRPGGSLMLQDSRLELISPPWSRKALWVRPQGALSLVRSSVSAAPGREAGNYAFAVDSGGALSIEGSAVHGAGYDAANPRLSGLYVGSKATITGSDLTDNLVSLACQNSQVRVANTTLGATAADLWLGNSTVMLLNVQFRRANVMFMESPAVLEVGWHLSVGVVWQNGKGVSGASLSARDGSQRVLFDGSTDPDGWVRWLEVLQYRAVDGETTALGDVGILAKRAGFSELARQVAMTSSREERLVFTDPSPPEIVILSPSSGFGTNQNWILVTGTATDDVGLDRVELRLDGALRWQELSTGGWSLNLTNLTRGDHLIQVRATDVSGRTAYSNLTLFVDWELPSLELEEPFDESILSSQSGVRFRGRTDPDASLTIDGIPVQLSSQGEFDRVLELAEGFHLVFVVSKDRGGNAVTATRNITVDLTPPRILVLSPANNTSTRLDELDLVGLVEPGARFRVDGSTVELGPDGSFNVTVLLSGGQKDIELYAEDRAGNSNTTTWTLDRRIDQPVAPDPLQRHGLALALAAVVVIIGVGLVAVFLLRRRRGPAPMPVPVLQMDAPPDHPRGG